MSRYYPEQPIGVFDSGVGGLSILNALRQQMPAERFLYFADSAHAPYGERSADYVLERSRRITQMLLHDCHVKALVVACNTATAVAIESLRQDYPELILIGVEPALKPAIRLSQTGQIAVLGTTATVSSPRFRQLHQSLLHQAQFHVVACSGLADAIEQDDGRRIEALCQRYLGTLPFGHASGHIDTIVLGCTHYPFARAAMQRVIGADIHYVETGLPVALHTRRRLEQAQLLHPGTPAPAHPLLELHSSGDALALQEMARRHLQTPAE